MRTPTLAAMAMAILSCSLTANAWAACPATSTITQMTATLQPFKDGGPDNVSKLKTTNAFLLNSGKQVKVAFSNMDLSNYLDVDALGAKPPKKKGEFVLIVALSNGPQPVAPGVYTPKSGYGKPLWATAEILVSNGKAGNFVSIGSNDGSAEIIEISGKRICGKFDLKGVAGKVSGTFNADLTK